MRSLFAVSAVALAAASNADVIYNTFGPGDTYNDSFFGQVRPTQTLGNPFSVPQASTLNSIDLALLSVAQGYTLSIRQGGAIEPGATIYTWTLDAPTNSIYTLAPLGTVALAAGDYYLVAESAGSGGWFKNSTGYVGPLSFTDNGVWKSDPNATPGAMRIDVAPVPEPASLAALSLGGAAFLRRRKKA